MKKSLSTLLIVWFIPLFSFTQNANSESFEPSFSISFSGGFGFLNNPQNFENYPIYFKNTSTILNFGAQYQALPNYGIGIDISTVFLKANTFKSAEELIGNYNEWQEIELKTGAFLIFQPSLGVFRLLRINNKLNFIINPGLGLSILDFQKVDAFIQAAPNSNLTYNKFNNLTFLYKGNLIFGYCLHEKLALNLGLGFSSAKHKLKLKDLDTNYNEIWTYTLFNIDLGIKYKLF